MMSPKGTEPPGGPPVGTAARDREGVIKDGRNGLSTLLFAAPEPL
jgi:hypothetical protein